MIKLPQQRIVLVLVAALVIAASVLTGLAMNARAFVLDHALDAQIAPADVTVVLGAAVQTRGRPNPCLVARVQRAAGLYHEGLTRNVVVTGGSDQGTGLIEAAHMADWLVQSGVPREAVVEEPRASSTTENITFSDPILRERGWHTVLLVSDPYHLPRAVALARRAGWEVSPVPATDSACWTRPSVASFYVWREAALVLRDLSFSEVFGWG